MLFADSKRKTEQWIRTRQFEPSERLTQLDRTLMDLWQKVL